MFSGEPAALEFGSDFGGCFPGAGGGGGPLLVAGVGGFKLLALGGELAGERLRVYGLGVVVARGGIGGLLPGVGFGLGGEPELAGDVGWGAGLGAFGPESAGLELAVGHAADDFGFVAYLQGADRG